MNSILWSNNTELTGVSSNQIYSCNISDGTYEGIHGNIREDPLWFNAVSNGYHLLANSPCIDSGTLVVGQDLDRENRPDAVTSDIGLDEYIDTDLDQLVDWREMIFNTDPNDPDTDGDGLSEGDESSAGTDPNHPDTDGSNAVGGLDTFPLDPALQGLPQIYADITPSISPVETNSPLSSQRLTEEYKHSAARPSTKSDHPACR